MKKIILTFILIGLFSKPVFAQTNASESATVTPSANGKDLIDKLKQIEIFKEKIATKVAQKREADQGAFRGKIKSINNNDILLTTGSEDIKITFQEDTQIFTKVNGQKKAAKESDLKNGIIISSLGYFNENKDNLLSKFIYIETENQLRLNGKIADLNQSEFTLTVKAKDGDRIIDIEKTTKTSIYEKGKGTVKAGFSKFKIGNIVFISAIKNAKEENRYAGSRIIIMEIVNQLTGTEIIASPTPSPKKK